MSEQSKQLTRVGEPGTGLQAGPQHTTQAKVVPMALELHHILLGIGSRRQHRHNQYLQIWQTKWEFKPLVCTKSNNRKQSSKAAVTSSMTPPSPSSATPYSTKWLRGLQGAGYLLAGRNTRLTMVTALALDSVVVFP